MAYRLECLDVSERSMADRIETDLIIALRGNHAGLREILQAGRRLWLERHS